MQAYGPAGAKLLSLREEKFSGGTVVTAVNRQAPLLASFRSWPKAASAAEAPPEASLSAATVAEAGVGGRATPQVEGVARGDPSPQPRELLPGSRHYCSWESLAGAVRGSGVDRLLCTQVLRIVLTAYIILIAAFRCLPLLTPGRYAP